MAARQPPCCCWILPQKEEPAVRPQPALHASVSAPLMCLALRISEARASSPTASTKWVQAIVDYATSYAPLIEEMDQRCFELAGTWKDLRCVDFVGDYAGLCHRTSSARPRSSETYGGYTTYDDSEGLVPHQYFLRDPDAIYQVSSPIPSTPSFNRVKETLVAVDQLGSLLVLSHRTPTKSEFADRFEVFTTPRPLLWLSPLMTAPALRLYLRLQRRAAGCRELPPRQPRLCE